MSEAYKTKVQDFCGVWQNAQSEFVIKTSGSTGKPKDIVLKREIMELSAKQTAKVFGLKKNDTALCCLNVDYIAGKMMLVRAMVIDMDIVITEPKANPFLEIDESLKIDFFAFVPLQIQQILSQNLNHLAFFKQAKAIILGGAALNNDLENAIKATNLPFFATYGMTETVSHIAIRPIRRELEKKVFQTLGDMIIDVDERFCLKICGSLTESKWLQTNDLVNIVNEKSFELLGRIDNVINSGGVKLDLEKIEANIFSVFKQLELEPLFFLFGLEDSTLGQKLVLVAEDCANLPSENELLVYFQKEMTKFEVPKRIFVVKKVLMTPTMKIDKQATVQPILTDNL